MNAGLSISRLQDHKNLGERQFFTKIFQTKGILDRLSGVAVFTEVGEEDFFPLRIRGRLSKSVGLLYCRGDRAARGRVLSHTSGVFRPPPSAVDRNWPQVPEYRQ